jgi:hypothetical protein
MIATQIAYGNMSARPYSDTDPLCRGQIERGGAA